jgi:hypothetical protein
MRETVRLGRLLLPAYPEVPAARRLPEVFLRTRARPPPCATRYLPGSHPPLEDGLLLVRRLPRRPPPRLPGALRPPAWPGRPPASRPGGPGRQSPGAGEVDEAACRELPPVPPASQLRITGKPQAPRQAPPAHNPRMPLEAEGVTAHIAPTIPRPKPRDLAHAGRVIHILRISLVFSQVQTSSPQILRSSTRDPALWLRSLAEGSSKTGSLPPPQSANPETLPRPADAPT